MDRLVTREEEEFEIRAIILLEIDLIQREVAQLLWLNQSPLGRYLCRFRETGGNH